MLLYKEKTKIEPSIVGVVNPLSGIWSYINNLPWEDDEYKSTKGRQVCHIANKVTYKVGGNIYQHGHQDTRISNFFSRLYPEWGIGLAMKYQPGGEIGLHRDSTGYGRIAYSISSCEFIFQLEDIKYRIPANNVISFPAKVPHAAYHIGDHERLVLCCWEFTPKRTAN